MHVSTFGWLLLLLGFAALVWGLVSIARRTRGARTPRLPPQAPASPGDATQPYQALPRSAKQSWTGKMKEIVAIAGGVVSIIVGVLTIIEKVAG